MYLNLVENFQARDICADAKETCYNWFSKIGAVQELLPRMWRPYLCPVFNYSLLFFPLKLFSLSAYVGLKLSDAMFTFSFFIISYNFLRIHFERHIAVISLES